jgi:ABC-2 type transport system permease protein
MRKVVRVARREYLATVRTRAFIIGLVLAPVLMSGSLIAFAIFHDRPDTADRRIAIVDRTGLLTATLARVATERNARDTARPDGRKIRPAYLLEAVAPASADSMAQRLALSERVRSGELRAFLEIGPGVVHPQRDSAGARVSYHARNAALDETRDWLAGEMNAALRRIRLAEAGIDSALVPDLFDGFSAEPRGLFTQDPATGGVTDARRRSEAEAIMPPIAVMFLMFVLLMMGAMPQLNSTMEEKSQRIAEVVLGSVRPFEFMLGKLIGGVGIAVTASAVYVGIGLYSLTALGAAGLLPAHVVVWFFAYMIPAVAMFGALYAALGAACNDAAEAQSMSFVGMLPMMIPAFLLMPVVMNPNTAFSTGISLFPLFAPILMLVRLATQSGVPAWQPWVALAGVVATALVFVWAGGRVFRVAILMQGTPPKLQNLVRWAIRG